MRLRWGKYWYDFFSSVLKHVGTALAGWGGVNVASATGMNVEALNVKHLVIFIMAAGVIPAVAAFLQKTPLPDFDEQVIVTTETKVTTVKPPTDETKPPDPPPFT